MHPVNARFAAPWLAAAILPIMALAPDSDTNLQADNPAYSWDLGDLYPSPSAKKESARLSTYASLKGDENVKIGINQELVQAAQVLATVIGEKTAWLTPEIISLGADKVHAFERQSPELTRRFGFFLGNALRYAPHTLGTEAEGVMAAAGDVLSQPNVIYSQLANSELPVPTVTLSDGTLVRLDAPADVRYREATNRAGLLVARFCCLWRPAFSTDRWPTLGPHRSEFGDSVRTCHFARTYERNP